MKWKPYAYESQLGGDGSVSHRPVIEIEVGHKGSSIYQMALVDSGSDRTLIDLEVAKAIRIDLEACHPVKVGGVGEKQGFMCDIDMTIHDFGKTISTTVVFVEGLPFGVLLGQRDFFEHFHVRFEKDKNTFYLAKAPKVPYTTS